MNIDVYTNSRKHKQAILSLPTIEERVAYVVKHGQKVTAAPMMCVEDGRDFYYPKLGSFIVRGHSGSSCDHEKPKGAVEEGKRILQMLTESIQPPANKPK